MYNQIIHDILKSWKDTLKGSSENINDLVVQQHNLTRKNQISCLNILNSREIDILIEFALKPSSQVYCDKSFQNPNLDYKSLPCLFTKDSRLQIFQ